MRSVGILTVGLMFLGAWLDGGSAPPAVCELSLQLIDAKTGKSTPGVVQILDGDGRSLVLTELIDRGLGLDRELPIHQWSVLPTASTVKVPQGKVTVRAFSGIESEMASLEIDLTGKEKSTARVPLRFFYRAVDHGLQSANTHVHLQKVSLKQSDDYLVGVAEAEGLDVVYVSYLERAVADLQYTSNKYSRDTLRKLSTSRVQFDHGEEHRHNFTGFGQGYGHVMLLDIPELFHPVSLGPGITKQGTDGVPLRINLERAKKQGSKIIWCHNRWGMEGIPSWLAGRLHANNIFDGGTHGSYRHSFYRYLNAGLKVPFSTGTDWFIYDFSRVYVPGKQKQTPEAWLDQLSAGRSTITNGPLLEFSVAGKSIGDTVALAGPGKVRIVGRVLGRVNFDRLEVVLNGVKIQEVKARAVGGHFEAAMDQQIEIDEPCWLALRTPPPSAPKFPEFAKKTKLNEYGRELFSHTSAVYVTIESKQVFDIAAAKSLLEENSRNRVFIDREGIFANDTEKSLVLAVYDRASRTLEHRIAERSGANAEKQ